MTVSHSEMGTGGPPAKAGPATRTTAAGTTAQIRDAFISVSLIVTEDDVEDAVGHATISNMSFME